VAILVVAFVRQFFNGDENVNGLSKGFTLLGYGLVDLLGAGWMAAMVFALVKFVKFAWHSQRTVG
jgi:hypothetical protein